MNGDEIATVTTFFFRGPRSRHMAAIDTGVLNAWEAGITQHWLFVEVDQTIAHMEVQAKARIKDLEEEVTAALYFAPHHVRDHRVGFHCRVEGHFILNDWPVSHMTL